MLPLSKEKLERVRVDEARLAESLGNLRCALSLDKDGGGLHGILVPVAVRVRGEGWDLVKQRKQLFCFNGDGEKMEVVGFVEDKSLWLFSGVTRRSFSEPYKGYKEVLAFPTQVGDSLSVRFTEETEEISVQRFNSGDYEEIWVYVRIDVRPVAEQIQILDSLLVDDNRSLDGVWKSALSQVGTQKDYDLWGLVADYYAKEKSAVE